jgi:hypothetical protein
VGVESHGAAEVGQHYFDNGAGPMRPVTRPTFPVMPILA